MEVDVKLSIKHQKQEQYYLQGEKIILRTDGEMKAPDMTGWSLRDAYEANVAKLQLNTAGTGYVQNKILKLERR